MDSTALERSSHVALYQQLAERIEWEIAQRRLLAFQRLPSEVELMAQYSVSRITVRQAVDLLVRRGLAIRRHGKGTFISGPALNHDLHELRGIYETLQATGLSLRTKLIDFAPYPPPERVRKLLGPRKRLMRLKRLYCVDDRPLGLLVCWLPPGTEQFATADAESNTIYGLLRMLKRDVSRADLTISGSAAGRRLGRLLGCAASAPLLILERVSYGADEAAREVTQFFVRSDGYRFTLSLRGPTPLAHNIRPTP
jgi:GntR family transcriptional regulator